MTTSRPRRDDYSTSLMSPGSVDLAVRLGNFDALQRNLQPLRFSRRFGATPSRTASVRRFRRDPRSHRFVCALSIPSIAEQNTAGRPTLKSPASTAQHFLRKPAPSSPPRPTSICHWAGRSKVQSRPFGPGVIEGPPARRAGAPCRRGLVRVPRTNLSTFLRGPDTILHPDLKSEARSPLGAFGNAKITPRKAIPNTCMVSSPDKR